ncbi:hypothetical protein [Thermococcus sp. JCM 11816]|uniref:hypothetical protein n=1 Tax=Thermococcus sp. (strain JCM 11816 / KS-1) TaxID=1295125 RepID=UPI000AEA8960
MDVFEEIEKREKRLNAIIEIAEDRLKHIEELGVKAKGPPRLRITPLTTFS